MSPNSHVILRTNFNIGFPLCLGLTNNEFVFPGIASFGASFCPAADFSSATKEPHHLLKELAKICILADCTLILAFSTEEAGRYLETYKVYENKPPDAIMEKTFVQFTTLFTFEALILLFIFY
jgi:hypothetical protein